MYGMAMLVGGGHTRRFESALRQALDDLGATVLEQATVQDSQKRYEWARSVSSGTELPTLAVSGRACGVVSIDVRGPRHPLYNLGLARRLSARLGVWSAAVVNDRLYDEYGCGFFYAGHVVEAAARTHSGIVFRSGGRMSWFHGPFVDVEDENRRNFSARSTGLVGNDDAYHWLKPRGGPIQVLALGTKRGGSVYDFDTELRLNDTKALACVRLDAAPAMQAVVVDHGDAHLETMRTLAPAGARTDVHCLPPTYDLLPDRSLDERESNAVVLRCDDPRVADTLLAGLGSTPAAAILRFDAPGAETWCRQRGGAWTRAAPRDLPSLLAAYDPVTRASREPPIRWDCRED